MLFINKGYKCYVIYKQRFLKYCDMCKSGVVYKLGQYMVGMEPIGTIILHRSLGAGFKN